MLDPNELTQHLIRNYKVNALMVTILLKKYLSIINPMTDVDDAARQIAASENIKLREIKLDEA